MKKNLRVRQASALSRRALNIAYWQTKKNPFAGNTPDSLEHRVAFEENRKVKIKRATEDVKNLEAKLGIGLN